MSVRTTAKRVTSAPGKRYMNKGYGSTRPKKGTKFGPKKKPVAYDARVKAKATAKAKRSSASASVGRKTAPVKAKGSRLRGDYKWGKETGKPLSKASGKGSRTASKIGLGARNAAASKTAARAKSTATKVGASKTAGRVRSGAAAAGRHKGRTAGGAAVGVAAVAGAAYGVHKVRKRRAAKRGR
jgi:hypothetical protein